MKFNDLAIGQQFEFEGIGYVKSGPLVAYTREGGKQKFMPRYAVVRLLGETMPAAKAEVARMVRADTVIAAFEQFYQRCLAAADLPEAATKELEQARKAFLDSLN